MTDTASPGTLLVVDDEEGIRALAHAVLAADGYKVLLAANGEEALALATPEEAIDLFLIDIMLPGMNGPQLGEELRRRFPETPIVFTSGYGGAAAMALHRKEPTAPFLRKPFEPKDLSEIVAQHLKSRA